MQTQDFIDQFLKPYIVEHFPNADLVILAGSFGRSMKNGDFAPQSSSDADLIVIYTDLAKDGMKTSSKIYRIEDVGTAMGGAPREMMIDANVHDLTTLAYHYDFIKNHQPYSFMPIMIDEGFILLDKTGIGPLLQRQAREFLDTGPNPPAREDWQNAMDTLRKTLYDIKTCQETEQKRFLGVIYGVEFLEYMLTVNGRWNSGGNQAYRTFARHLPEQGAQITQALSDLVRKGDSAAFENFAEEVLARGEKLLATLPAGKRQPDYPPAQYLPAGEREAMGKIFVKFMAEHLVTAFDKSAQRGDLAFIENLSATVRFMKQYLEQEDKIAPLEGLQAMAFLSQKSPDLLPMALQAADEAVYKPLEQLVDRHLQAVGGIGYTSLVNFYAEDLARVHALEQKSGSPQKTFKADYKI